MTDFVHLHVHTQYSLLDGACRLNELVEQAKKLGQKAIAITDHGVMYGVVDFYKAAKEAGIKPIIGCEVYCAPRTRFDKTYGVDSEPAHLVLLAKNEIGYKNLIRIVSAGFTEGFYNKPRIDDDLLREYHEGIICLSACLAGRIARMITTNDYLGAKNMAISYLEIFGKGNYYLELQDHGIADQKKVNAGIIRISKETGIPMVATNDVHYIKKEDSKLHDILMCIQMNKTITDEDRFGFETEEFYLKSGDEMSQLFSAMDGAIENSVKIADMCNFDFTFGKHFLPRFDVPDGKSAIQYLTELCKIGFLQRYGENDELQKRLTYELSVIEKMGYVDYFLIVHDFIKYAKDNGIEVGPGRGSAAGSIVSYCLYITDVDPIAYDLIFERFLNPERVSMPDIDIDFCYERRQEVIDYVKRKYGDDHVAQIVTFGTMAAKGAIRDVGRAMAIPYKDVDTIAKLVPFELGMTLEKALKAEPKLSKLYNSDIKIKALIDMAMAAEGMPRHASTHAAGVVITDNPVSYQVPLSKNDESVVTQFPMGTLEELGLLKMDFLGLRTLTVIRDAQALIRKHTPDFSIENIPYDDKMVYDMIGAGITDGVFQLESTGMKQVLTGLKPNSLEDIIAVISLYRPGPMDSIPRYIKCRHNPQKVHYKHERLKPILNKTYGCIVYQEQVMRIVQDLAGYSLGRADMVRRAMSKKKADVMEKERKNFIYGIEDEDGNILLEGAIRRGVDEKTAGGIFEEMTDFAKYAFNKSHAAAYAFVAYRTAYLKCHFKEEFMAALMTSFLDSTSKIAGYIEECKRLSISVLPPDINESDDVFTVKNGCIRFGLVAVKNIGRGFIKTLMEERKRKGAFLNFYDFCKRMSDKDLNKRAMESLIKCGALDSFGCYRSQMMAVYAQVLEGINLGRNKNVEGQMNLFDSGKSDNDEVKFPKIEEYTPKEKYNMEKETVGLFLSGHPMSEYSEIVEKLGAVRSVDLIDSFSEGINNCFYDGQEIIYAGVITNKRIKTTRSNTTMAFLQVEDLYSPIDVIVFPKILQENNDIINEENIVAIKGRINVREDEAPTIICLQITVIEDYEKLLNSNFFSKHLTPEANNSILYIKLASNENEKMDKLFDIIRQYEGNTSLCIYFHDIKQRRIYNTLGVSADDDLIKKLEGIAGRDNVKLKK